MSPCRQALCYIVQRMHETAALGRGQSCTQFLGFSFYGIKLAGNEKHFLKCYEFCENICRTKFCQVHTTFQSAYTHACWLPCSLQWYLLNICGFPDKKNLAKEQCQRVTLGWNWQESRICENRETACSFLYYHCDPSKSGLKCIFGGKLTLTLPSLEINRAL